MILIILCQEYFYTHCSFTILRFLSAYCIILPSLKYIILLAYAAISLSCVTMIIVFPILFSSQNMSIISAVFFSSSAPVGSSANIYLLSDTYARAMAALCCSPPDNYHGYFPLKSYIPSLSIISFITFLL